jgi:Na+-driven multidrug efflux pump
MKGHEAVVFRVMGWSALMNVVLNAIFIMLFGAIGAATATSFTIIIWNIWLHFESHRRIGFSVAVFSRRVPQPKLTSPRESLPRDYNQAVQGFFQQRARR